jgi:hypothetical protein
MIFEGRFRRSPMGIDCELHGREAALPNTSAAIRMRRIIEAPLVALRYVKRAPIVQFVISGQPRKLAAQNQLMEAMLKHWIRGITGWNCSAGGRTNHEED